jgi:hypothetical protein
MSQDPDEQLANREAELDAKLADLRQQLAQQQAISAQLDKWEQQNAQLPLPTERSRQGSASKQQLAEEQQQNAQKAAARHLLLKTIVKNAWVMVPGALGGSWLYDVLNNKNTQNLAQNADTIANGIRKTGEIPSRADLYAMQDSPALAQRVLAGITVKIQNFKDALGAVGQTQESLQAIASGEHVKLTPGTSAWQNISDLLTKGMQAGGLARGPGTQAAKDVEGALGALANNTGIAKTDLVRVYTAARDAASADLGLSPGVKPTSAQYQTVMNRALKGLDEYITARGTTFQNVSDIEYSSPVPNAQTSSGLNFFRNPFGAPANAATPPGMGGGAEMAPTPAPTPSAATGGVLFASADALRIVGGVMACWGIVGAAQAMQRKDADRLDKVYYGSRIASGVVSMAGISNPFTAAAATGLTLMHLSRDKTLQQITDNLTKNEMAYQRLTTDAAEMNQWQRTAQLAVCVASSLPLKASHALSTHLNAAREGLAGLVGWGRKPQMQETAFQDYMQLRDAQQQYG